MSTHVSNRNRQRLSVAMIVRDAADTVLSTFECIEGIADEIVVADLGSSDQTISVLKEHVTTIVQVEWHNDFSAARNECLEQVTGDWVLWLDAGERISAEACQQLRAFIDGEAKQSCAYMMIVKAAENSGTASEQMGQVRLVPNLPNIRFSGRVRESMEESIEASGLVTDGVSWRIEQNNRGEGGEHRATKARQELLIAQDEMKRFGPKPKMFCVAADAMQILGDSNGAAECYRSALHLSERGSLVMLEAYYGLLTSLDGTPDALEAQLAICLEGVEQFPLDAQLLCAMGGYLQGQNRLDIASRAYETAFQHGRVTPQIWHLEEIAEITAVCYAVSLQLLSQEEKACEILEEALATYDSSLRLRRQLIDLYIKSGRKADAMKQFDQLPTTMPHRETLRSAIKGACLAAQKNWLAAKSYLETAYSAGCRDTLCFRWLSITLLAFGEHDRAKDLLGEWLTSEPTNPEPTSLLQLIQGENPEIPWAASSKAASSDQQDTVSTEQSEPKSKDGASQHRIDTADPIEMPGMLNPLDTADLTAPQNVIDPPPVS